MENTNLYYKNPFHRFIHQIKQRSGNRFFKVIQVRQSLKHIFIQSFLWDKIILFCNKIKIQKFKINNGHHNFIKYKENLNNRNDTQLLNKIIKFLILNLLRNKKKFCSGKKLEKFPLVKMYSPENGQFFFTDFYCYTL